MYELIFWNYTTDTYLNHHLVYEALLENKSVDGLEILPIPIILNRIANVFSAWEKVDENSWKNASGQGAFHIKTTPQSIKIDCYGTQGTVMDTLVDILNEYKCPLYDPEIPARYDEFYEEE
jgi:hypothetical protein